MRDAQQDDSEGGSDEGAEHIVLGIPVITLGAEEGFGGFCGDERGCPFDQFINRADRHAEADGEESEPASLRDDVVADEDLAADDGRDESLHDMAEAVVVVPRKSEDLAHPFPCRHPRIGVLPADHQYDHVKADQDEREFGKSPALRLSDEEGDEPCEDRSDLQPPRRPVVGLPARPSQDW